MVTHSSIYAWKIPGTAGAGGLQSMSFTVDATVHAAHTVRTHARMCLGPKEEKRSLPLHPNFPSRQENVLNPSEGEASLEAVSHSLGREARLSLGTLPQPLEQERGAWVSLRSSRLQEDFQKPKRQSFLRFRQKNEAAGPTA